MERLIQKLANSFAMTTGLDREDLFQEAYLAYLEAMKTYDSSRGQPTTHIWHCVSNHLKNYIKKQPMAEVVPIEDCEIAITETSFWEKLSSDALSIAKIVLTYPLPFLELGKTHAPKKIKEIMKEEGWNKERINFALFELKNEFCN